MKKMKLLTRTKPFIHFVMILVLLAQLLQANAFAMGAAHDSLGTKRPMLAIDPFAEETVTPNKTARPDGTEESGGTEQPDEAGQPDEAEQPDEAGQPDEAEQPNAVVLLDETEPLDDDGLLDDYAYTISFNLLGGETAGGASTLPSIDVNPGDVITLPWVYKAGAQFTNWTIPASDPINPGGIAGARGSNYTAPDRDVNLTLDAGWWENATNYVTITFDHNYPGGPVHPRTGGGMTYAPFIQAEGTPTRPDAVFDGWHTAPAGGTLVTELTPLLNDNHHTVYAHWRLISPVQVLFDLNYPGAPLPNSRNAIVGQTYADAIQDEGTPGRTGYTFMGWFTEETGGTEVTPSTTVDIPEDHTLYARWCPKQDITVTFHPNGGDSPTPGSITVTFGQPYGALATTARTGYTFMGWFTEETGGTEVTPGTTVDIPEDHTLYAHWLFVGSEENNSKNDTAREVPLVYMTKDISPAGLMAIYEALGRPMNGRAAIKIDMGELCNAHHLSPDLVKELADFINGTIVTCNTANGGLRDYTDTHRQVAQNHGFTAIAAVDIMDEFNSMMLPVQDGKHLKKNLVGENFANYDFFLVLTHFTGHAKNGFNGAVYDASLGIASSDGKRLISMTGKTAPEAFQETAAEAAKSVSDHLNNGKKIIYITIMNNLSVDSDCESNPAAPDMRDIGILASLDPVALDQACLDQIYAAPDGESMIQRIESVDSTHVLNYAQRIGLGSRAYRLVNLDD